MQLPRVIRCLVVAASLGGVSQAIWSMSPATFYVRAEFLSNSTEIGGAQLDALEVLVCRFGSSQLHTAIVIGYAAEDERNPDLIAKQRAERVKEWMMANAGWPAAQIYTESKAAAQPVATNSTFVGRAKNRRVEIELIRASHAGRPLSATCRPAWQDQLFALSGESALVMARALVRSGRVSADAPLGAALQAQRLDLFEALANRGSGLRLTPEQHEGIARRALISGQIRYFQNWLKTPEFKRRRGELGDLFLATCEGLASDDELAALIAELHERGVVLRDDKALACAIWRKSPVLAEAYLTAGATRFMTPQIVVDAGRAPHVLERLLARGADPRARTAIGTTLFHTMRLNTVADVRRLLDWGLDINAKGPTFPGNSETTPLREAVTYATSEVLDAMKQAGARVEEAGSLQHARANPDAQVWLLRNGLPIFDEGATVVQVARQDKGVLPVLTALRERGVDMGAKDGFGQNALGIAIERYQPEVVRFLVDAGVDTLEVKTYRMPAVSTALKAAESLSVMALPPGYQAEISGSGATRASAYLPVLSVDFHRRKDQIIDILKEHARSRSAS